MPPAVASIKGLNNISRSQWLSLQPEIVAQAEPAAHQRTEQDQQKDRDDGQRDGHGVLPTARWKGQFERLNKAGIGAFGLSAANSASVVDGAGSVTLGT